MASRSFPDSFLWGAATASYQVEGGVHEGGRGESIWDRFSHTPGKVANGDTGDVACDHYHRFREDVALMQDLGLQAYRFSIAWPRLFPTGAGSLNRAGLDFYSRLVDALLEAGIQPVPTLYHWDLPQALQDAGGWPNPDTARRFADYATAAFEGLGDRVARWITLNEPGVVTHLGHYSGEHAPGEHSLEANLSAGHTLLHAHGLAVQRYREICPDGKIGITLSFNPARPATDEDEDHAAAARWDAYANRWFMDPIYKGVYPEEMRQRFGETLPEFSSSQLEAVRSPIDFVGVNYYTHAVVQDDPSDALMGVRSVARPGAPVTAMGWEIVPGAFFELLTWLKDTYHNPVLYITENGAAFPDVVAPDGGVHDPDRIAYLQGHFSAALDAIQAGVDLRGYFVWSLMDNFEWAYGYDRRFGLVYIDYPTSARILKDSAKWYARVIRDNGISG
ncbi:MAG TPA: GH1 family beta-glucosidase [Armatimonadota bacterium]|jgi:beta-glucosidase